MVDIKIIRENPAEAARRLRTRNHSGDLAPLLDLDRQRRELLPQAEALKARRNQASTAIGQAKKSGQDPAPLMAEMKEVADKIKELDARIGQIEAELRNALLYLPNLPHASVPEGKTAADNKIMRTWGQPREFPFPIKDHLQLGEALDIIDFKRGAKISGAGFPLLKGPGARLERALINFFLDMNTKKHGYREIFPPFLVNEASMTGTGQLPKFKEDMYRVADDPYYLIPTAEVPLTNILAGETLPEKDLPVYYTAYSGCFRREAGSYGKDVKGFQRVHQFNKVEMVKFVKPETSYDEHETLVADAEYLLQQLELPYRVLLLCSGDMGFSAAKRYDLEVYAPADKKWLEVSSCSNFEDFQARRANIRFKDKDGVHFVHTLNGSGLATPRVLLALLENNQNADGTINIPAALQPYMDGMEKITG